MTCTVRYDQTADESEAVWCHVQVQAPLKASSALLITLTTNNVTTPLMRCISASPYRRERC